jgi:hypothetical protein
MSDEDTPLECVELDVGRRAATSPSHRGALNPLAQFAIHSGDRGLRRSRGMDEPDANQLAGAATFFDAG